ncbi:MAG: M16 family metallopeptidase [Verrucomicrobiales bacterium]
MYKVTRLENGLRVATAHLPHMASISLGLWVGVGGRHEEESISGVSHFIEHMLFKGTKKRNAKQISQDVEGIGGYLNAFTTEECTCFYSKACADQTKVLWEVLSDMFLASTFPAEEVEKERNVIKEEMAMYLDQPHHHVQDLLNEALWPDQPLGRPLIGNEATITKMGREDLIGYQRQNYVAESTLVAAAGNVDHSEMVRMVEKVAKKFFLGKEPAFTPSIEEQKEPRIRLFTKETEQTQIALGIKTTSRHDERRYALRVLNALLGENMSSRLFQVVREDHGLAYSICSSLSFFNDIGSLTISAGVETEKTVKAIKLIVEEMSKFAIKAPSLGEVKRSRDYCIGQLDLSLENTENQMMWIGENLLAHGRIPTPAEVKKHISQVTPAQIRAAAKSFFHAERLSLALVSPMKRATGLDRALRKMLEVQ